MRASCGLVFPSMIEGFGFPLVEAMAAGCPVVTSNIPVTREIVEDAAEIVDPQRADLLARAMARLQQDADHRADLRARGNALAQRYQWRTCAADTIRVYRRLVGEPARSLP